MGIVGITSDGSYPLMGTMDDVFSYSWGKDMDNFEKIKGSTGTVGIDTAGAMNAVYGPYLMNLAYNQANTLTVLGQKPYKTGRRFQADLSMSQSQSSGVVRGGFAPQPTYGTYEQVEMPYKVLAKRQAMNLGYTEIGDKSIDDVMTWEDFFAQEGKTWLWSMNNDVLRPVDSARIVGQGSAVGGGTSTVSTDPLYGQRTEFVGYESIDRIISNYAEGGFINGGEATSVLNVPWALDKQMPSTDSAASLAKYRNPAVSGAVAKNNFNCYVDANYTTGSTDASATLRQLDLAMLDSLFMSTMPYWDNNQTQGKALITRYDTLQHIQTLLQPQQRYLGQVAVQYDMNGVSTAPGRDTGFIAATYNGVPLIPDLMVNGGTKAADHGDGVGDIFLFDNNILFNGVISAPVVNISQDPIITGRYTRLCDMYQIGEVQVAGMFRGLGKIKHLQ